MSIKDLQNKVYEDYDEGLITYEQAEEKLLRIESSEYDFFEEDYEDDFDY